MTIKRNQALLSEEKLFNELDSHFARFLAGFEDTKQPELLLAAKLVSAMTAKGDICVNISEIAGTGLSNGYGEEDEQIFLPEYRRWLSVLRKSKVVGYPGDYRPLILDEEGRLYLYRYWEYEQLLIKNVQGRISGSPRSVDCALLRDGIARLFHTQHDLRPDWQRVAACAAALRRFSVISGGPGTGKTFTVIKIIALLLEQGLAKGLIPSIALAAPTGKAAARLKESIAASLPSLKCREEIKPLIPAETFTIHRLLGAIEGSPYFRYNAANQLPYNVVVIDESSMADLALLSKLFQAVPLDSHLILLGDRDQLASVESGAVLGDLCDTGTEHYHTNAFAQAVWNITGDQIESSAVEPPIADSLIILNKSYRFGTDSGIGTVSQAVKKGDADGVIQMLSESIFDDIRFVEHDDASQLSTVLARHVIEGYGPYLNCKDYAEAYQLFSRFRILCALRHGPWGVERVNNVVEHILNNNGWINSSHRWYCGKPLMVIRNDYTLRLFNGDVGIVFPDPMNRDTMRVYFPSFESAFRKILPLQLPDYETAYALTIHKSQGSEFDHVVVLFPNQISPVLTRELFYTAITRARKRVEIWGTKKVLRFMINNPTRRASGLRDALWRRQAPGTVPFAQ